ncbi:uncharacterized protein LOC135084533 [Ostrinia nubilalis]|uniref:uncharacterized protein LOC135084533 n=1 Tax=Ostrinia nubilalis TaxID=29057 RepID=UPI0030823D29
MVWSGSRPRKSSYEREKPLQREMTEAERSIRMKPVPRTSVARNDLKPRAPPIKKPLTSSQSAAALAPHAVVNAEGLYEIGPRSYRALKAELEHLMFTVTSPSSSSSSSSPPALASQLGRTV